MGIARSVSKMVGYLPLASSAALAIARRGAPIFMLHRVLPAGTMSYSAEMVISSDAFDALLTWLTRHFEIAPLGTIAARVSARQSLRGLCCLTFDDGWVDNYQHALPVLEQHHAPATIFLVSRFIGSAHRLWQERLWMCLQNGPQESLRGLMEEWRRRAPAWAALPVEAEYGPLRRFLLTRPSSEAEQFAYAVQSLSPDAVPGDGAFLDWDQVRTMQARGIEFGAHTQHHVLLTHASAEEAWNEIDGSRRELQSQLGTEVGSFAYPWGAVNAAARQLVRDAGFRCAVGIQAGVAAPGADPWVLPRIFVADSVTRAADGTLARSDFSFYLAWNSISRGGHGADY